MTLELAKAQVSAASIVPPPSNFGLGAGVGLAVAGLEALDRDMGVDLRGGGRGVAEDLLDAAQVGAALEEVGRRAVADAVRARVPGRSPPAQPPVHAAARPAGGQAAAPAAAEHGRSPGPP